MVATLTTSGHGVDVVIAAAGTGKTFSLDAARDAWQHSGHRVIGSRALGSCRGRARDHRRDPQPHHRQLALRPRPPAPRWTDRKNGGRRRRSRDGRHPPPRPHPRPRATRPTPRSCSSVTPANSPRSTPADCSAASATHRPDPPRREPSPTRSLGTRRARDTSARRDRRCPRRLPPPRSHPHPRHRDRRTRHHGRRLVGRHPRRRTRADARAAVVRRR